MRELSLFTGAGGGLLGTKLLGWEHLGYVEYNEYCQKLIAQRIKDGILDEAPIFSDIRAFISEGYAESYQGMVDVITAGWPCQPFSVAGKQAGADDPRNMWPATVESIRIIRPRFVLLENVPGLLGSSYFGQILADLSKIGFNARWKTIPASKLGAPIIRSRLFIVAIPNSGSSKAWLGNKQDGQRTVWGKKNKRCNELWLQAPPRSTRMVNGYPYYVDRVEAIGNAQVPAVVATAWRLLTEDMEVIT